MSMSILTDYTKKLDESQRKRLNEIFVWLADNFPQLEGLIRWNQPMFTDHGTLIVAFAPAKQHLAIALEIEAMNHFEPVIAERQYSTSTELVRIPWSVPFDYDFLRAIVEFNLIDKANVKTFWRHETD